MPWNRFAGSTPLMFAAAANRHEAIKLLAAKGADVKAATKVIDLASLTRGGMGFNGGNPPVPGQPRVKVAGRLGRRAADRGLRPAVPARLPPRGRQRQRRPPQVPGVDRQFQLNELVAGQGGFTPLLFAARDGFSESAVALLDAGADVNQVADSDKNSPLLTALINGHFDLARLLVERGADVNWAADNGATPLYAVLNVQWAPKALYPSPRRTVSRSCTLPRHDEGAARQGRRRQRAPARRRCGTRATASTSPAWTRLAPRRSGGRRTPATSTR